MVSWPPARGPGQGAHDAWVRAAQALEGGEEVPWRSRNGVGNQCGLPPPPELDVLGPPAETNTVLPKNARFCRDDAGG